MVHINLVPEKIRSAEALKVIVLLGACSLAIPALFWGWRYQGERAHLARAEQELKAVNDELASPQLKEVVAAVEQFTKDQADLESKRSIVDQLRRRQVVLLKFLDAMPDIMPGNGRVNILTIADVKGSKEVNLTCDFLSLDAVASVYENLEASPLVDKLEMLTGPSLKVSGVRPLTTASFKFVLQDLQ